MRIVDGKIAVNKVEFTVEDGKHRQTFSLATDPNVNDLREVDVLHSLSRSLIELGKRLQAVVISQVATKTKRIGQPPVETFEVKDGSLIWIEEEPIYYEWYKIYIQIPTSANGLKKIKRHYVVHDGLMTDSEAEECFSVTAGVQSSGRQGTIWGKTGRYYNSQTKSFHSFDNSPVITRVQ